MQERIIYKNPDGSVAVLIPAPACGLTIHQIAAKDVPAGVSYKVIDAADLPPRDKRAAWDVSATDLTDGVGADYGAGTEFDVIGWKHDGTPELKPSIAAPVVVPAPVVKTAPSIVKLKAGRA